MKPSFVYLCAVMDWDASVEPVSRPREQKRPFSPAAKLSRSGVPLCLLTVRGRRITKKRKGENRRRENPHGAAHSPAPIIEEALRNRAGLVRLNYLGRHVVLQKKAAD